ncbi:MAG: ABC transporter permease [Acidimicrobiia bacterium]|nr:ABC transporter permease [Acidimicrobiia bacterium]
MTTLARRAGFGHDVASIAGRALRLLPRDGSAYLPAMVAGVFILIINIAALGDLPEFVDIDIDYESYQLPVGILFAVTGLSRAYALVLDIEGGYLDRLLLSPISRVAILLGLMVADVVLVAALSLLVVLVGFVLGVEFTTGVLGVLVFVGLCALWGLAFAGFPYAIALRTGNPGAVAGSWVLAFPFLLLTTAFVPREAMADWLAAVAAWNPMTYVLSGLRSLFVGWDAAELGKALGGVAVLAAVSMPLAFGALASRVRRN